MKIVRFSLEQGHKYFGKIDGNRFFIGVRTSYQGGKGLSNVRGTTSQKYNREEYKELFGFWADFIHPTAMAEGAFYHTLNTYDRARFTFSFLQYAAHVPNGDFVVFLRALLMLPLAAEYFPDLMLVGDRIHKVTDAGRIPLEDDVSTAGLMDYLNPSMEEVEDTEVIQAAKFVHWAQQDPAHRRVQVNIGISHFKKNMVAYAQQYGLDGMDDVICLAVADIRHQGRAKSPAIATALRSTNPLEALLSLGEPKYHQRVGVLRQEIKALLADGSFGQWKYSLATADFVNSALGFGS